MTFVDEAQAVHEGVVEPLPFVAKVLASELDGEFAAWHG